MRTQLYARAALTRPCRKFAKPSAISWFCNSRNRFLGFLQRVERVSFDANAVTAAQASVFALGNGGVTTVVKADFVTVRGVRVAVSSFDVVTDGAASHGSSHRRRPAAITISHRVAKRCTGAHKLHRGRALVPALKGGT